MKPKGTPSKLKKNYLTLFYQGLFQVDLKNKIHK